MTEKRSRPRRSGTDAAPPAGGASLAARRLLARADVISEGQRGVRGGRDAYLGSTMLTIDLPSLDLLLREACDAGTARRLAELLEEDKDARTRIEALAAAEAARVAGATPTAVSTHVA